MAAVLAATIGTAHLSPLEVAQEWDLLGREKQEGAAAAACPSCRTPYSMNVLLGIIGRVELHNRTDGIWVSGALIREGLFNITLPSRFSIEVLWTF